MTDVSFSDAAVAVRSDIGDAHARAWQRLAEPGTWWTGAERVAIAAETRAAFSCHLCADRKAALSPFAVDGEHDRASDLLSDAAVDVVHRITTDASRLTRSWLDKTLSSALTDGHYVEIVGTVVSVVSVDAFCRGIGGSLHPLPTPIDGAPSQHRPASALPSDAWVPMISEKHATGAEADIYPTARTGNVIKAMSLVPDEVRGLQELSAVHYMPIELLMRMQSNRAIDRGQVELIAGRVSALNECFY